MGVDMRFTSIGIALVLLLAAGFGCIGDPYEEYTALSGVEIDPSVVSYKDAGSIARERANSVEANLLLRMFDVDYVGREQVSYRHGKYEYSFGKYEAVGTDPMGVGYEVRVVLDIKLHMMDEITVMSGDPKAVDVPFYDLDVSEWAITEDEIFEYIYTDIGRDVIEGFERPVVSWGGRATGQPDGGPLVIAQCYDEGNYEGTLHSYFFDPRTGKRVPDSWPTGLE
jgi:hypothetical protein